MPEQVLVLLRVNMSTLVMKRKNNKIRSTVSDAAQMTTLQYKSSAEASLVT